LATYKSNASLVALYDSLGIDSMIHIIN